MAAPHNVKRYGETWNTAEINAMESEIHAVKDLVVVSGGWAWHYMSPEHVEYKHAHDHKDADLFVRPDQVWELMTRLAETGYEKTWTRFDDRSDDFHRYVKMIENPNGKPIKIIFDLFTGEVPFVETIAGVRVVEPVYLLSLYGVKHSSDECFSVSIAKDLTSKGISPNGNPTMADYSRCLAQKG